MSDFVNAARTGDMARIRAMLEKGQAKPNEIERKTGMTALHAAASFKNNATSYMLLTETNVDPSIKDKQGRRAIDIAMETGDKPSFTMLYEATHAKNHLSLKDRAAGDRSTILPYKAIATHAARQTDKGQGR